MNEVDENESRNSDIVEIAKAIPDEVYIQSADAVVSNFNKLISPLTETTMGLGLYIKQKFENLVEVEKKVAVYSLQNALHKAKVKSEELGVPLITPVHAKSFVKSIEEASKEIDPLLHELWENLLADQFVNSQFHPHFVEVLPHFSPREAKLLSSLNSKENMGDHLWWDFWQPEDSFKHWVFKSTDRELKEWDYSCTLLKEFRFVDIFPHQKDAFKLEDKVVLLFRTEAGSNFLNTVAG